MKIALVSQEYPPETARGGIGSQTYSKAKGLSALGHEVYVISRSIDRHRHQQRVGNVNVIRIPGMDDSLPEMTTIVQWLTHSVVVAAEIGALNKLVQLDIIDFPEWAAEGYAYLLNRTAWNSVPVVIQLHGPLVMFAHAMGWPEIDSDFYRTGFQMEATAVQMADAIYSSSKCSAQWISSYYQPHAKNYPVIHVGVDTDLFIPKPYLKYETPTVIFIGKLVPNKGVTELVEACLQLIKDIPGLRLRLIGNGENSFIDTLKEKAIQAGAASMLDLPGFINKDDLPDELAKAHVFASPSWYEGGPGFVFLEAMACGLPVIGCSGSGVDEIINHGYNGMLVPPKNAQALEDALRKILNDKELLENLGVNARDYVLREADSRGCLKKLEDFYIKTVHGKSSGERN